MYFVNRTKWLQREGEEGYWSVISVLCFYMSVWQKSPHFSLPTEKGTYSTPTNTKTDSEYLGGGGGGEGQENKVTV